MINGVSEAGWSAFSAVLRNPESALEIIDLSKNSINDEVMHSFSNALASNTKLKKFNIQGTFSITSNGFAAFTHLLCNSSSILTTYQSNHIIEELWKKNDDDDDDDDREDDQLKITLPEDLMNLLQLNKENSPNEAARLKIIMTHFSGHEINMQPSVRPYAIAWMGRDDNLYRFLRAMPSLLEAVGEKVSSKKRARTEE